MRTINRPVVAPLVVAALAVAVLTVAFPWAAVRAQCFDLPVGSVCTYVAIPTNVVFSDPAGNIHEVVMSGNMTFQVTQTSETPCRDLFVPVALVCTGVNPVLGTLTLTLDNSRTATHSLIAANQEGTPFPAWMEVFAYLRLTVASKPGITYQSVQQLHLTCGDAEAFCAPHVPNVYMVNEPVEFEDIMNQGVVSFTFESGYLRM